MATILERNKNTKVQRKTREEYAEDALYREVWEEVNNEKTLSFIKKYYRHMLIVAGALIIIAAGIQIGLRVHHNARIAGAVNYEEALALGDAAALDALGRAHGANGDLAMLQSYAMTGDAAKLEYLADNGKTRDIRDLARLHVVARMGDTWDAARVEKYLGELNTKKSPYYYTAILTIAQKHLADGNRTAANTWLDKIINDADAPATAMGMAVTLR